MPLVLFSLCTEFQSAADAAESGADWDPAYPAVNTVIEVRSHQPAASNVRQLFDRIAVTFFTLEYVVRFACCPRKLRFFFG